MASTWPQGLGSAQSRTQMPIFVHTLETREGPLFLSFPSMKLAAYLHSMKGAPQVPALSTPHSQPTFLEPGQSPSRGLRTREAEREQVPPVNFHLSLSSVPVQS